MAHLYKCWLNRVNEFHDGIAVFLRQFAEFLHCAAGIALGIAMPHDGLDDGLGATVVQTVAASSAAGRQATAPERGGAAPARADVVLHVKLVLDVILAGHGKPTNGVSYPSQRFERYC